MVRQGIKVQANIKSSQWQMKSKDQWYSKNLEQGTSDGLDQ